MGSPAGAPGRRPRPFGPQRRESILNETTERLIALQDLLQLKRDIEETSYEELGFEKPEVESIEAEIESLREEIDPAVLRRYERISEKYDRPLVPVRKGVCYGCFVRFPTARMSELSEATPTTCESCGRLLYQIH
ncbi:MAG: C4-type zinc ribbon domain-containing protein [Gemmatimonadota bacterium]|nr:C4-type zinc ribbon domain-containing protein [Gemmatimonadota bacterium]